jgi:acyl carrier protein
VDLTRAEIDRLVLETVADVAALEVASLRPSTPLLDICMDSLTLVAIVTRIEATYDASFDTDELAAILRAGSVGDIAAIVARKLRVTGREFAEDA